MTQVYKPVNRSKASGLYAIASITVVLFVLGLLGTLLLNTTKLSRYLKESLEINLVLNNALPPEDIEQFDKSIQDKDYVIDTRYISKEEAAIQFEEEYGEEFTKILGFNPLENTLILHLDASYSNPDSLLMIESSLIKLEQVSEVNYPKNLMNLISSNVQKLSIALIILAAISLFMAITLIDNTIKLSMYSSRFLIKSMQLVGATRKFILRPFLKKSLLNGIVSGFCASALLMVFLYFVNRNISIFDLEADINHYLYVCFSIIVIGVMLSYWSTKSAVIKYLKLKLDELY